MNIPVIAMGLFPRNESSRHFGLPCSDLSQVA
jgi:hypothetical protein